MLQWPDLIYDEKELVGGFAVPIYRESSGGWMIGLILRRVDGAKSVFKIVGLFHECAPGSPCLFWDDVALGQLIFGHSSDCCSLRGDESMNESHLIDII